VNTKGGESVATPAMWAAQRGHYYIVSLLLRNGADPLLTDIQGYNVLHLATFDGNIFMLVLLLHQNIPVDVQDTEGHTCLMWAAYKGYPACVDLFLRWGASVAAADNTGFTALHWALVKGSQGCVSKIVEYGADRFAVSSLGKSPAVTAKEMQTLAVWYRALSDAGYDAEGNKEKDTYPFNSITTDKRLFATRFFFLLPFLMVGVGLFVLSALPIFVSVPLTLFILYSLNYLGSQALRWAPSDIRTMNHSVSIIV
jgi:palmitoyltransferase ZDHHC13/17